MVTEVEMWSVRVSGWNAETARALSPLAEIVAVPDTAFDGAALLVSIAGANSLKRSTRRWSRPGHRCVHRPSSAAMQRAIRCPRTGRLNPKKPPR